MSVRCEHDDCYWFKRCVSEYERDCYVACDNVKPEPVLKNLITIKSTNIKGDRHEAICETRAEVALHLNGMPKPAGFISVLFNETGVLLTGTQSTFIRAIRSGILWEQGDSDA